MPKVYSYIRFSSKAQAGGDSLRRQTADTAKWAARHGHQLDEQLTFRDLGVSAYDRTNLRNGALGLFLRAAQEGKIERGSILAIEALDRLTRAEPLDAFRLLSDIVSCGIRVVTVSDERIYDEASLNGDFASLMLAAALLVRGHEESKRKSERLKSHYSARREREDARIAHVAPQWLKPEGEGWGIHPEHAGTVLYIYQLAADGLGSNLIARRLNEEQRPRITTNRRLADGWYPGSIAKLLRNPAVIGHYQPHAMDKNGQRQPVGDPLRGHYPAIVPEELYWRVRAIVDERLRRKSGHRKDAGYSNILGGILKCGYCGGAMYLDKKGRKRDNRLLAAQYYYGCANAARHASPCDNRVNYLALLLGAKERPRGRYPRPLRLSLLYALLEHLLVAGEQISEAAERRQEAARQRHDALSAQRNDTEARKATLIDALESGVLTSAEAHPRLDRLRKEVDSLHTQIAAALAEMRQPDTADNGWIEDAVDSQMAVLVSTLQDVTREHERAALRVRLQQRVETIYLYRECARIRLRLDELYRLVPLQLDADLTHPDAAYPVPPPRIPADSPESATKPATKSKASTRKNVPASKTTPLRARLR